LTDFKYYLSDEPLAHFDTVFKLYFVNAHLTSLNSPLLLPPPSTPLHAPSLLYTFCFLLDSSPALSHLDDHLDAQLLDLVPSFADLLLDPQ
jgi:hypothetical protein